MVIHQKFADFVLFLYVHMAYADGGLHESEKEVILAKMKKLFPSESNRQKKLEEAEKEYLEIDSRKVSDIIKDTFLQFKDVTFASKYRVYTDMYDVINADGVIDESETAALTELKKIIDIGSEPKSS